MLVPILYMKGISTGDFEQALAALLGKDAPGLSASTVARLSTNTSTGGPAICRPSATSKCGPTAFTCRSVLKTLSNAFSHDRATPEDKKELLGFTDGARESAQDWRELLLDLQNRSLVIAPELAIADGALGFWKALGELWPATRGQRC